MVDTQECAFEHSPFIVLVAGMPRSGSTWLFNAANLVLNLKFNKVCATWITDYDQTANEPCHLVKAHRAEQVNFKPTIILTSRRPLAECIASSVRMGWLKNDPHAIANAIKLQQQLYMYWHSMSHYEVNFADMLASPDNVIAELGKKLGVSMTPEASSAIASKLHNLTPPEGSVDRRYDPVTLLHPNHRGLEDTKRIANDVRQLMTEHGLTDIEPR